MADAIVEHRNVLDLEDDATISKGGCARTSAWRPPLLRYNILLNRFYNTKGLRQQSCCSVSGA